MIDLDLQGNETNICTHGGKKISFQNWNFDSLLLLTTDWSNGKELPAFFLFQALSKGRKKLLWRKSNLTCLTTLGTLNIQTVQNHFFTSKITRRDSCDLGGNRETRINGTKLHRIILQ